ncbi:metal ABC transporter permease [Candidatus Clavichlamydia salmonicola]|uniref:metal ABC transporter permease n=1 Tax=Candidatus Clavichlamydia salmonicola TaxID=469812 RepID=UPI0018911C11|nr:metal ABC transporter permease [Candidatus Clavichlamydia salmonicola]
MRKVIIEMEASFTTLGFFLLPAILGATILCTAAGLIGSLLFVTRRSLMGEVLTHASYPGILFGMLLTKTDVSKHGLSLSVFIGGLIFSICAVFLIEWLEKKIKISSDAAHGFILTTFFGCGILLSGYAQASCPSLYGSVKSYLYGQSLTLTIHDVIISFVLLMLVISFLVGFYKELLIFCFDAQQACLIGLPTIFMKSAMFVLIALISNMGIKSMGVLLMSAVFVASPLAARQFTVRFHLFFILSGVIGGVAAFIGNYLSFTLPYTCTIFKGAILPPGPSVVLLLGLIATVSLLFSPKKGLFIRYLRKIGFKIRSKEENFLKIIWKLDESGQSLFDVKKLKKELFFLTNSMYFWKWKLWLSYLCFKKLLKSNKQGLYGLDSKGLKKVKHIIRLHRLWELYLSKSLSWDRSEVHKNAEEIEHVLTDEMEEELTKMLNNPYVDPHNKIIPPGQLL